jgi:hypothetical protein
MALAVELHPHARERAQERGVTEAEIVATVNAGERRLAKHGRTAFRRVETLHLEVCGAADDMLQSRSKLLPSKSRADGW